MTQRVLTLELIRDGHCTPWGFRMSGGADIGAPMLVQKVSMGSPAEGELQKGDIILSVAGHDARKMSHHKVTEIIAKAGNLLKFVIARSAPDGLPTSPTPPLSLHGSTDYMKPLPRTEFQSHTTTHHVAQQNQDEKQAIATQAYRTLPLITPTLKASKDIPTGSYLRHSSDTSGRPTGTKANDPYMLTRVQEAILEAALSSPRASESSSRTSTPDIGYQNMLLKQQYNSPIQMYSHQAVLETLNAQTKAMQQTMPIVQTPTTKAPTDITKSPTYQMIHEEELKHGKVEKKEAVETKIHDLHDFPRHGFEDQENIHQSGSFKVIMATLKSTPGV